MGSFNNTFFIFVACLKIPSNGFQAFFSSKDVSSVKKTIKPKKPTIDWVFYSGFFVGFLGWVFWVGFFMPTLAWSDKFTRVSPVGSSYSEVSPYMFVGNILFPTTNFIFLVLLQCNVHVMQLNDSIYIYTGNDLNKILYFVRNHSV